MGKVLIFSDLHVHSHKKNVSRLADCLEVLDWALATAVKESCEDILFLGDLFHERSKIDILNYLRVFEAFFKFYAQHPEINVYLLVGNHDMYHKESWDVNSVKPLSAIPNVHIMESPTTVEIQGVKVDFLPHVENPIKQLEKLKEGRSKDDLRLLLGHLAVHGATLNTVYATTSDVIVEHDDVMEVIDPDRFTEWDQTFLGHYHGPQVLTADGSVEYVGSPLELSYGEAYQDKHIIVFDMKTFKKEYIDNDFSPKHLMLTPDQIDQVDLDKNFVKMLIDDTSSKELVDIRKKLKEKNVADLQFKAREKKKEDAQELEDAKSILYKSDEMLSEYVKTVGVPPGLDYDLLMNIGKTILQKGTEASNE